MKQNKSMQKEPFPSAPAEFDSAFTHFLEHSDSGLMLVGVPTGVGKTYQAQQYIFSHFQEKTIFYVTPLNKNVKKAYESTRKLFEKHGMEKDFDKRAIHLQSNLDMFEQNISKVRDFLDDKIITLPSFRKLAKKSTSNVLDSDEREEKAQLESKFRSELRGLLISEFKTTKPKELLSKIKSQETYRPLLDLYPSIRSIEMKVFFLSVDKLYMGNSPIIETHYDFLKNKMMDGALVFLDEFDSTKEQLLGKMIEEAARDSIDLPKLFRDINDKIRDGAPSINEEMLLDVPDKAPQKTSRHAYESMQSIFRERVKQYNLDKKFKYSGESNGQYFILSDWSIPIVAEVGKKESPELFVRYDAATQSNIISNETGGKKLTSVFRPLSGAIEYYVNAVKLISSNQYEYRKYANHKDGEVITIYDAVESVLDNFDFKPFEANSKYLSPLVNNKMRRTESNIRKDKFDIDFYSTGFDFISISTSSGAAYSSKIECISLHTTPEDYLVRLAQKAHVIGLSATADFMTVTGNYDLHFLRRNLGQQFYEIPEDDKKGLNDYIQNRLSRNQSTPIPEEITIEDKSVFGLEEVFSDYEDAKHYANELKILESSTQSDSGKSENEIGNNCKRFAKIFKSIIKFIDNKDGRVLLVLSNRNVGKGTHEIDNYKKYCKEAGRDISNVAFIPLVSKTWDEDMKVYNAAINGKKKVVLFTCYQAASTGQNLQFVEKLEEFEGEQDIDSIYIENPTNLIVQNKLGLSNELKIEGIYQVEALSEFAMLKHKKKLPLIKAYLSGISFPPKDLYNCSSTNMHALKTLCQAIGRVSRTENKKGNAHIYIDEEIISKVNVSPLLGRTFTKEFSAFIDYVISKHYEGENPTFEDEERINAGENQNSKAKEMIDDFIGDWADFSLKEMEAWARLRNFVLSHPTINNEELILNPDYRRYYLQRSTTEPIDHYFYSGSGDFINDISYKETDNVFYEVSDENSSLEYLGCNKIITDEFSLSNIPILWEPKDFIILPTIYRNIYKGAIGERCVKKLLEANGIILCEITDPKRFERFDYVLKGREDIGFDAKFWSLSSAMGIEEEMSKEVEVNKVLDKMKKSSFSKGIIINLLCEKADKHLRKPHREGNGKILIIPSLINPDSKNASLDKEALEAIHEFLEESQNGRNE